MKIQIDLAGGKGALRSFHANKVIHSAFAHHAHTFEV